MIHPFVQSKNLIIYYWLSWSVVLFLHTTILFYYWNFDLNIAFSDAIISTITIASLGLIIWFPVRYINTTTNSNLFIVIGHIIAALFILFIWYLITNNILQWYYKNLPSKLEFYRTTKIYKIIITILYYLILLFVYFIIKYYNNLQEKQEYENRLKIDLKQSELNYHRAQINPHFLFNSLNSISLLTITNPLQANEMIIKLSEYLRYSLKQKENEILTLDKEIENIKLYLDIEKTRFGEKMEINLTVDENCIKCKIPNMILQPLVENAVKHGVQNSTNLTTIDINCEKINNMLNITISNNIDGEIQNKLGTGTGLKNILSRLQLIYKNNNLLSIIKKPEKYIVKISFPQ